MFLKGIYAHNAVSLATMTLLPFLNHVPALMDGRERFWKMVSDSGLRRTDFTLASLAVKIIERIRAIL